AWHRIAARQALLEARRPVGDRSLTAAHLEVDVLHLRAHGGFGVDHRHHLRIVRVVFARSRTNACARQQRPCGQSSPTPHGPNLAVCTTTPVLGAGRSDLGSGRVATYTATAPPATNTEAPTQNHHCVSTLPPSSRRSSAGALSSGAGCGARCAARATSAASS